MAINSNAKTLTSLSKSAAKVLGEKPMVWFALQSGSDYIFGIDKKVKDPNKFKKGGLIKKYLDKLKVDTKKVDEKGASVAGLVTKNGDAIQIAVVCKANGGGKSTLKALSKDSTFKKLLPNAEIVKRIGPKTDEDAQEDALDEAATKELQESGVAVSKEVKSAIKYFMWWKQGAKDKYLKAIANPTLSDEDDLQKINGRLKKFAKNSMYKLFKDKEMFSKAGALAKFKESDFDLTKENLKEYLANIKTALKVIEGMEDQDALDEEASAEVAAELEAVANDWETVGEILGIKGKDLTSLEQCATKEQAVWKVLWKDFATNPAALTKLKNGLSDGTWENFFAIAKQFEGK